MRGRGGYTPRPPWGCASRPGRWHHPVRRIPSRPPIDHDLPPPPGTINVIVCLPVPLSDAAFVHAAVHAGALTYAATLPR